MDSRIKNIGGVYSLSGVDGGPMRSTVDFTGVDGPVSISGCQNLDLGGMALTMTGVGPAQILVSIDGCTDIDLHAPVLVGYKPTATDSVPANWTHYTADLGLHMGVQVTASSDVKIYGGDISSIWKAFNVLRTDKTVMDGTSIHDMREGINVVAASNTELRNLSIRDMNPRGISGVGDHADAIQCFGLGNRDVDGLLIESVTVDYPAGTPSNCQGFILKDAIFRHKDITVRGCRIKVPSVNGMLLGEIDNLMVDGNILEMSDPTQDSRAAPYIRAINCVGTISNNQIPAVTGWNRPAVSLATSPGVIATNNGPNVVITPPVVVVPPVIVPPVPPVVTPPPVVVPPVVTPPVVVPAPVPDLIGDMMRAIGDALIVAADARKTPMP